MSEMDYETGDDFELPSEPETENDESGGGAFSSDEDSTRIPWKERSIIAYVRKLEFVRGLADAEDVYSGLHILHTAILQCPAKHLQPGTIAHIELALVQMDSIRNHHQTDTFEEVANNFWPLLSL